MHAFLSLIIMPLPILYLLLIVAFIFFISNQGKTGSTFLVLAGIWLLIISTPFIPKALVKSLESKYPQLTDESIKNLPDSCDIIVLGGGHSDDKDLSPNNQLSTTALGRLAEGIRIHRMIPGSRLVLSGYRGESELSQALVLYQTALLLGVDSALMTMQILPSNTRMEAEEYAKNFGTGNDLIVVTDDLHMPRAMMLFQKAGLNPVASPTNQILKYGSHKYRWRWIPSSGNIGMMEAVIHEYVGMIWTWVGGK
jgi:uncharacterized SAM-binding protein YcdF (DUF218 family)